VAILAVTAPASAQFSSGGSGGSGGSIGGSSFGGSGGSSGGSFGSGSSGSNGGSFSLGGITLGNITQGSAASRTSATSNRAGATSIMGASFGNPLIYGLSNNVTGTVGPLISFPNTGSTGGRNSTFGQPMYTISTTGANGLASVRGGSATGLGGNTATITRTTPFYASSVGVPKTAQYVTEPRFRAPQVPQAQIHADVSALIARSPRLESRARIQVLMDGPVVVLRGTVLDDEERQVAADMVRLTPGVSEVRNELTVRNP